MLTGHAGSRLEDRGLHEFQLRTMLLSPSDVGEAARLGRWFGRGRAAGARWKVILEPDAESRTVLIVIAYRDDQ